MKCQRCESEMIVDMFFDFQDDTGKIEFQGWRCVICGNISDPVIRLNQKGRPSPRFDFGKRRKFVVGVN